MVTRLRSARSNALLLVFVLGSATYVSYRVGLQAYISWLLQKSTNESLNRAIALDRNNCEAYFRLGLSHTLVADDLKRGQELLQKAVKCQPLQGRYWLSLAAALETTGRRDEAITATEKAAALESHNSTTLWQCGNLLLRTGNVEKAFDLFYRVLQGEPSYGQQVFSACWRISQDGDLILRRAIPDTLELDLAYLRFLSTTESLNLDEARKVWTRLLSSGKPPDPEKTFPYFDALLNANQVAEAIERWDQMVLVGALPKQELHEADNLIVNGGFEATPVNGGLDWRIYPFGGVDIHMNSRIRHNGTRSLVVHFEGLTNLDFQHVVQMVPVARNTRYQFSTFMKSQALSTLSGPHFEIFDPKDPKKLQWETSDVLGTTEWSEYRLTIKTGPRTDLLTVRLRRKPAVELDKRIEGTLWVDDVSLTPAGPESARKS